MQFANYTDFRSSVLRLIDGDSVNSTSFSIETLDMLIALGESRVYNGDAMTPGLRASTMIQPLAVMATNNLAPLPADLLELKEVAASRPLEIIPLPEVRRFIEGGAGGQSAYAAQDGDSLTFWPQVDGAVSGSYYARPEMLKTVVWANATTFARYPELFLFACLYECAMFIGEDGGLWEKRYREQADGANKAERWRVYSGSPLRQRSR